MKINVNGKEVAVEADANTPLLWVIRDELNYTGTKYGCGKALCGACTVHLDGQPVRSCSMPVSAVADKKITTIEGLGEDKVAKAVMEAWQEHSVPQCGYCQSGQVMSAVALLRDKPKPTDNEINGAMSGNICRCGTYNQIHAAIQKASKQITRG